MLALKEEHFGSDFHDGWRVDGHSNGEQAQLRFISQPPLAVEVLQSSLKLQSLVWAKKYEMSNSGRMKRFQHGNSLTRQKGLWVSLRKLFPILNKICVTRGAQRTE